MEKVIERIETPISHYCDVLVCGGGVAGISAAIAAARSGKRVILTERCFLLGGLATAGLITIYLPLCDGYGRQVSFGLAEELLKLSICVYCDEKLGYHDWIENTENIIRNQSTPRYKVNFNPQLFAISAEQLLRKENVTILYGTTAVGVSMTKDIVDAVIFENKSGRFAISAKSIVDATGDADIARFANAPTVEFNHGNNLAAWYYFTGGKGFGLKSMGVIDIEDAEADRNNEVKTLSSKRFIGLDGNEISEYMCLSHEEIMKDILKMRERDPGFQPTTIATIPQLRMTRRIDGEYVLHDTQCHKFFEDSIGMVPDWRKRGPVYEVPFRTLYTSKIKNLLFAGRITSVTDEMWDIMRVIPCCAVTGEAAGIAASMFEDLSKADIKGLQRELEARGVMLHERDL